MEESIDERRRRLLELMYAQDRAPLEEKAEARRLLLEAVDRVRQGTGITCQELLDYLREFHYRDYYRRRRLEERGHV